MIIRQWEQKDVIKLRPLVKKFLESQANFGGAVPATEHNINYHIFLGFDQIIKNNDPHLVCELDGELVGFIQMGQVFAAMERLEKTCEIFGIFVEPAFEHRFIGAELLRAAAPYLVKNGYKKAFSGVLMNNYRMLKNMFHNPAIWPTRVFLEWDIGADEQFSSEKLKFLERKEQE